MNWKLPSLFLIATLVVLVGPVGFTNLRAQGEPDFQDVPGDLQFQQEFGSSPQELPPEAIAGMVIGGIVGLIVGLAIAIAIILVISSCYSRIPQQYRLMEPGMVWLLLIPCFP